MMIKILILLGEGNLGSLYLVVEMPGTFFPLYYQWVRRGTKQSRFQPLSPGVSRNLHYDARIFAAYELLCYHRRNFFVCVSRIARPSGRNLVGLYEGGIRYGGHCCFQYM